MTALEVKTLIIYAVVIIRLLTLWPLCFFIGKQLKNFGKDNGTLWRVRRLTLLMAGSLMLVIVSRLYVLVPFVLTPRLANKSIVNEIVPALLILFSCWYAYREVRAINKH